MDNVVLHTLAAVVSYRGSAFCGFARQPGQLTVQGELERALRVLFGAEVLTVCAGRTDAGVHARGQVISFDISTQQLQDKTDESIKRSLNALTHDDIIVRSVEEKQPGFSARFDAVEREYRYFVSLGPTPPMFMRDFSWYVNKPVDVAAMRQASLALIGEHDFKSFCLAASARDKTTMRNVSVIDFEQCQIMGEDVLVIKVVGNAFLHSMVRTIVGTLMLVGRHQREIEWVNTVLDALDRSAAGENAPACGLVFWEVRY